MDHRQSVFISDPIDGYLVQAEFLAKWVIRVRLGQEGGYEADLGLGIFLCRFNDAVINGCKIRQRNRFIRVSFKFPPDIIHTDIDEQPITKQVSQD